MFASPALLPHPGFALHPTGLSSSAWPRMAAPWLPGSPSQGPHCPIWVRFGTWNIKPTLLTVSVFQEGSAVYCHKRGQPMEGFFAVKSPIPSAFTVRRNPGTRQHLSQLPSSRLLPCASR